MDMPPGECGGWCSSSFGRTDSSMSMMREMQMSFYWGKPMTLLFSGWPDGSLGMYWLALFSVFFFAIAVEALSILTSVTKWANSVVLHGLVQSFVYVFQMALAYMVMLSVMSFNGGVFVAAVVGHGVGHFVANGARRLLMKGEVSAATNSGGHA